MSAFLSRDMTKTPVEAFGPGFFKLEGEVLTGNLALFPSGLRLWSGFADSGIWRQEDKALETIFVGMGAEIAYLPKAFAQEALSLGLRLEPMSTPSALKMYNLLLSEGRRVCVIAVAL